MPFSHIPREHTCCGGVLSREPSWWLKDAQGIELCRVCDDCREEKAAHYRPEILSGYTQADVDEDIEPEYADFTGDNDIEGDY